MFLGSTDAACEVDRPALQRLADQLPDIDVWFCSPMLRARQTMDALQEQGCCPDGCTVEPGLREIDFGSWEGRTYAEIAAAEPERVQAWSDFDTFSFPGGESTRDFVARCDAVLQRFLQQDWNRQVAAVCHGGVIRMLICLALGLPPSKYLFFQVDAPSLTVLDIYSNGGVLCGLNL